MKKNFAVASLAILLACGVTMKAGFAMAESILGKWLVKAETPNGTMPLEFEFKLDGTTLTGFVSSPRGSAPLSALKFEDPNFAADIIAGNNTYKLSGTLKEGRLAGTWEQADSGSKGNWTAERAAAAASAASGGVVGTWDSVAVTPNGDLPAWLEIKQEGDKISGQIGSERGSMPIEAASFKENKLQFDLSFNNNTYRIQAVLEGDKLTGNWSPVAGGESGAWRATRKAAAAAEKAASPAAAPTPVVVGTWAGVALTPNGDMPFQVEIRQAGETLAGTMNLQGAQITLQQPKFADNKLTFQIDFQGGTYRVEAAIANDKLSGKWAEVGGSENGTVTAERKKS